MQQTWPINQVHENQCVGLIEELHIVKPFLPTASAICVIKTESPGLHYYKTP
jgi:hypothetical protein